MVESDGSQRSSSKISLLFVCTGNTCRSPMAAALAMQRLGKVARIESAGIAAHGGRATPEAIQVMREFGIDISGHRPRDVSSLQSRHFDYVIALAPSISEYLKRSGLLQSQRVISWDITDPVGQGIETYRACAKKIAEKLTGLVGELPALQKENL